MRLRDLTADGRADLALGAQDRGILLRGTSTVPTTDASVVLPGSGGGFRD